MNVYEIATKITMQNAASGVLAVLAQEVLSLEGGISKLNKAFSEMGRTSLAMLGGLGIVGGMGIVYGLKAAADHAKELSHQLSNIQKLGMTPTQVASATSAAYALPGQVPGMTSASALAILNNINSIVGPEGARKMLGPLAQFGQAMGAQTGNYEGANESILKLVRSADLLGKFVDSTTHKVDLNKLESFLDLVAKVSAATHGMVKESTWLMMAQQGGPALSSMSDEGLMSMAMAAQAMGGFRAGTAMTSLYQQMIGGKMTALAAGNLQKLGLVGNFEASRGGGVVWAPGALDSPFAEAMKKDPLAAEVILRKAMEAHGYDTIEKQIPELFRILGRQTTQRLVHDFLRNEPQMFGERGRMMQGAGVAGQLATANAQDYERNMYLMGQAWKEMMAQIGLPITKVAIESMKQITPVFLNIAEIARANPEYIANLARGLGILGVALIGGGAVAILAALGPAGWFALGMTALGTTILTYQDVIKGFITGSWVTAIMDKLNEMQKAITGVFQGILDWIASYIPAWMKKVSYEGGDFGGGGIIRTSYGGGGGPGSGIGGSVGRAIGSSGGVAALGRGQYAALIRERAAAAGVDPTALLKIYGTEGAGGYVGDHGSSFGPFQLHMGGMAGGGNRFGGMGDIFKRETGLDPRDPSTAGAQVDWMIRYGKKHGGYSSDIWHGLRGHGGSLRAPEPYRKQDKPPVIENTMYLDGEPIHRSVVKRMVKAMTHPTTAPYHDGSRHFTSPDAGLIGV